jgi:hypothetical protein
MYRDRYRASNGCHRPSYHSAYGDVIYLALIPLPFLVGLVAYANVGGPRLPPETDAVIDAVLHSDLSHVVSGMTGLASSSGVDIWFECRSPIESIRGTVLLNMAMAATHCSGRPPFSEH